LLISLLQLIYSNHSLQSVIMADAAQQLNIATYFIMSAPVGEVDEVVSDVKKLIEDPEVLNDAALTAILRDYNTEQMTTAPIPGGNGNLVISKFGEIAADEYLDPSSGVVYKFDHLTRTVGEATEKKQQLSDSVENLRSAVQKSLEAYLQALYKPNKVSLAVYGADDGSLTVALSAKNVNLSNFWTGSWRAVYNVSKDGQVKGAVKLGVHYFEEGNVQLHTNIEHKGKVDTSSPDSAASDLRKLIESFETSYQNSLEEMYVNMHTTTFKNMRRILPLNKVKFQWNSAAHSLAAEVTNK